MRLVSAAVLATALSLAVPAGAALAQDVPDVSEVVQPASTDASSEPEASEPEVFVLPVLTSEEMFQTIVVPVEGAVLEDLDNSFFAPRSGGRTHRAIDIAAPHGTPLLAATDGTVIRKRRNRLGGITLYLLAPDGRHVFYYAHLANYARGLEVGDVVRAGDVVGYVGNTGNARNTVPHLHFAIWQVNDVERPWRVNRHVNPYPHLHRAAVEALGAPERRARASEAGGP